MIKNMRLKNIILFTLPVIFTMVFMSFYTMVDGIFVSNLVGEDALSAINVVYPAISIIIALALMLATGGNAIIAKLLGEGKKKEAKSNFTLITVVGGILGIVISVIFYLNLDAILNLLQANNEIYTYCKDYLGLILMFLPFLIIQIIFQTALVTANKPGLTLISMLAGGITNIVLDYVFIETFNMGISGAALATGLGYFVPFVIGMIIFFNKNDNLHFTKFKINLKVLKNTCLNGSSEMVSNIAMAITTFLFNVSMLNLIGNDGVAAITVIIYSQLLLNAIFMGYSMGISPVISFNYGEQNSKNLKKIFKTSIKLVLIFSLTSTIAAIILSEPIASIFTDSSSPVYNLTKEGLSLFAISFIFAGLNIYTSAMFTAYSNGLVSALLSFLRTFILITICLLVLPNLIGVTGVWIAIPLAEFLTFFISIYYLNKYKTKYMYSKNYKDKPNEDLNIITIEREFASGGREVGKRLADALGYNYYDEEIINMIASDMNLDKNYIDKISEKHSLHHYNLTFANTFKNHKHLVNNNVQFKQAELIRRLAMNGNAIFVGRCSDHLLDEFNPFKVFIYSSNIDHKIKRCIEKDNNEKDEELIKKQINNIDKKRKRYYSTYTGKKRDNLNNYNLSLDTSKVTVKECVSLIEKTIKKM